jgi:hypothetical protein
MPRLTIIITLLQPQLDLLTRRRNMGFMMTRKTKAKSTPAFHRGPLQHIRCNSITATRRGTPGNMRIIFDEGFSDKPLVFLIDFLRN